MNTQRDISIKPDDSEISAYYRFAILGMQAVGSGNALDSSGQGRHAILDPGNPDDVTGVWGTDPWISTKQGGINGGGLTVGGYSAINNSNALPWQYAKEDSMIVCVTFKTPSFATLGSGGGILGCITGTTNGWSIGESSTGSGGLGISLRGNEGDPSGLYEAGLRLLYNVTDQKVHTVVLLVNGNSVGLPGVDTPARTARVFLDGREVTQQMKDSGYIGSTVFGANTISPYPVSMGHNGAPGVSGTIGINVGRVHGLLIPKGYFPANGAAVAAHYNTQPKKLFTKAILGG